MKRRPLLVLAILCFSASPVLSRPLDRGQDPVLFEDAREESPGSTSVLPALSAFGFTDTVTYGGTTWATDSLRWEAIRDSCWTFDSGVGSSINLGGNPNKPAGYHQTMEGWSGIDRSLGTQGAWFNRSSTCALNGSFSAWAGVTLAEANGLCYATGQGYGNSWNAFFGKTFSYPGSGGVTLSFSYAINCEPGFDYFYVIVDTTGTGTNGVEVIAYTGITSGTASIPLQGGTTLRSTPGPVTILFNAQSDAAYSDEDGLFDSVCGHSTIDDIGLSGAITDFTDFESGANGWAQIFTTTGVGDFSSLADRGTLPPPTAFCPCAVQDSVLVFFDLMGGHPLLQDNIAVSPWIDLKRGGDLGRPGRLMMYSVYAEMPITNYVFVQIKARYYPAVCAASGAIYRSPFLDQNFVFYFGESPFCNLIGTSQLRDYSSVIPVSAEQVQVGFGMINLCLTAPFFQPCSGVTNTTPWLDNIALGVFGSATAPIVTLPTFDRLQDSFAQDGSSNPASPGRVDTNTIKNGSSPIPGTILRDTMVVRGDGGNTEVRIYFAVKTGAFTSSSALAARAARWTPEAAIAPLAGRFGNTWYSARLDTAEQGGVLAAGNWMSTFHESDPGFQGTDRSPDPQDPSQLENEIFPDHILTGGSRIDYFIGARYLPPDPRNVGGVNWSILPDTTGGRFREMEVLPHFVPDSLANPYLGWSWNCVLYVDHHQDRGFDEQAIEEQGLQLSLGPGIGPPEGTRYDRFDVETPSSGQLSFGRAIQTNYGCSFIQIFAYKAIVWHSGTLSALQLTDEDANVLGPWLTIPEVRNNRFWGSGDGLVRSMSTSNEPSTISFMQNNLGVLATCNTVREANCPAGTLLDSTFCLPLTPVAGAHFPTTGSVSVRGNGCNALRSFDVNGVNNAVSEVRGQLDYLKNGTAAHYASVTHHNTFDVDYRTVVDGFAVGSLAGLSGDPHNPLSCSSTAPALDRTADVINWFDPTWNVWRGPGYYARCFPPYGGLDVPDSGLAPPPLRPLLSSVFPNPMTSVARIGFTNARDGARVRIDIFDVTGRLVRSLVDGEAAAGPHEVTWDGSRDTGRAATAGLYFVRMSVNDFVGTKTVVVTR